MLKRRVSKPVIDFSCPVNLVGNARANKEEEEEKKKRKKHSKKKIERKKEKEKKKKGPLLSFWVLIMIQL